MFILNFNPDERIGTVESVDTTTVIVRVDDENKLQKLQVNHLVILRSSLVNQHHVGLVTKIMRKSNITQTDEEIPEPCIVENIIKISLIGTFIEKEGSRKNIFKRTLESVPDINADCFILDEKRLTTFMETISQYSSSTTNSLSIGKYALDKRATAYLNGNKLFQRHLVITGSTGSGKSYTVAHLLEQISKLKTGNAIVFDIHGEYTPLIGESYQHYKIAGPSDTPADNILFLPYWLLSYEENQALLLDRSDSNAPNQAMALNKCIYRAKREFLEINNITSLIDDFTVDSPIPYDINSVIRNLHEKDIEMVRGTSREKQGALHGKLSRLIQRLKSKTEDKRLNFIFNPSKELFEYEWFTTFAEKILLGANNSVNGIKIINFSEVPPDILPLITGLFARIILSLQIWSDSNSRHPIALFCDEAHLYIPERIEKSIESVGKDNFERIAKEGRKYGISLVVISQRPADVNRTVLSQSNNFIAMRLTNVEDQNVIRRLLPDSLGNYADLLTVLDVGEAIIVGDASILPSRVIIDKPTLEPNSMTVDFWDIWASEKVNQKIKESVEALRKQSKD